MASHEYAQRPPIESQVERLFLGRRLRAKTLQRGTKAALYCTHASPLFNLYTPACVMPSTSSGYRLPRSRCARELLEETPLLYSCALDCEVSEAWVRRGRKKLEHTCDKFRNGPILCRKYYCFWLARLVFPFFGEHVSHLGYLQAPGGMVP